MGLFDKKYCDICGEKIGLLGNRKLEDGNICKDCAGKLSPWFNDRRHSDLASIKQQLEDREANREDVANFNVTLELGEDMKVLVDEDQGWFMVTDEDESDLDDANPDVISFDEVVECNLNIDEEECELYYEDEDGDECSYSPRRFEYTYRFNMTITLDHPYLDEITFQLNEIPLTIEYSDRSFFGTGEFDPERDSEYRHYLDLADEIMDVLTSEEEYDDEEDGEYIEDENGNEVEIVTCPYCGSRSKLTYTGRCEQCGGNLNR